MHYGHLNTYLLHQKPPNLDHGDHGDHDESYPNR